MYSIFINQWHRLSVKSKQLVFYALVILFVSLISSYLVSTTYDLVDEFNTDIKSYYTVNQFNARLTENKSLLETFLKSRNTADSQAYFQNVSTLKTLLDQIDRESNNTLETYYLMNSIRNGLNAYLEKSDYAIVQRLSNSETYFLYFYEATHICEYVEGYIQKLLYVRLSEGSWFHNILVSKAKSAKNIAFISIVAISMLCLGFALVFSHHLTGPLRKLAKASIEMSEGNLDVGEIEVKSSDEVGVLTHSFNKMSFSIKQHVDSLNEKALIEKKLHEEELENIKIQKLLKEAEFLALQSQINPHFLFNTLNAISRTSMFGQTDLTTKLIKSMSDILRYSLTNHKKAVSLSKEIEIIKGYIFIQHHRFGERLKYELKCSIDTADIKIPCFSLQPLVENAIIHGIEPSEDGGAVRLRIYKKGTNVIIKIIDNGIGISKDKINSILKCEFDDSDGHTTGIGINNVITRLRLYFNEYHCFKIKSKVGIGTVITISFQAGREVTEDVQAIDS